jgi:phosphate transport system protein
VQLGAAAVADCDIGLAQRLVHNFRSVRDLDIDLLEANVRLMAIHQPLASDLRFMIMLSRTAYDLERINQEAMRLADLVEASYKNRPANEGRELFDDVLPMANTTGDMLQKALSAIAGEDIDQGIAVVNRQEQIERQSQGALRRLATYIMQDPRNIPRVIDATIALKGLERVADHSVSIAKNLIFACSGKDVRHINPLNLNPAYLKG